MHDIDIEAVRLAMFAHPGVKAVEGKLRLYRAERGTGVAARIVVAAPDVDQALVRAIIAATLQEQFGIAEVDLQFKDPGPAPDPLASRGPLEKK